MPVESGNQAIKDGTLLTQFHLVGAARRQGRATMARILSECAPATAYVPTCDEFLLSHVVDREVVLDRQAYFFAEAQVRHNTVVESPGGVQAFVNSTINAPTSR